MTRALAVLLGGAALAAAPMRTVWKLDRLDHIGGYAVRVEGDSVGADDVAHASACSIDTRVDVFRDAKNVETSLDAAR